jgi:7,8-dihydropterin-6-yl-methyl-4-(beta-D-ribofuranosyl)aminobenzene 5'-phosphate synthase
MSPVLRLLVLHMAVWISSTNGFLSLAEAAASNAKSQITILYDAFGRDPSMKKDWGFSALVEIGGKQILFDTGDDSEIFAANAKAKGVDFKTLDFVVVSHRHSDHIAGLSHVLAVNPDVKVFAPKENFGIFGSSLPSSFYRQNESLPAEMRYFDGKPPEVMEFGKAWQTAHFELIDKTTEVAPGVWLIALVSDAPGTLELKELSLAINTPDGIVLIVGCSHPGIERIVEAASAINPKIHYVVGGFHLLAAPDDIIAKVTVALKDRWRIENIAPGHCTGEPTFDALRKAFGEHYVYAGLGTVLQIGTTERRGSLQKNPTLTEIAQARGWAAALQGDDLRMYRRFSVSSPDAVEQKLTKWLEASFSVGRKAAKQ